MIKLDACWDCGSLKPGHHTPKCEMAERDAIRDVPQRPGTQWITPEAKMQQTLDLLTETS